MFIGATIALGGAWHAASGSAGVGLPPTASGSEAEASPPSGPSPATGREGLLAIALAPAQVPPGIAPAQPRADRTLTDDDLWTPVVPAEPGSPEAQLFQARRALVERDYGRAISLATAWLERHDPHPLRPEALLIRGDALFLRGDEYKALFDYEAIATLYPGSEAYIIALERELEIANKYAEGLRRKLWGFRWVSAEEEAQELFIRIQERLPGSILAEQAGMSLADFYFRKGEMLQAAEAYQLFIENYPRSTDVRKARLRLIYARLASFKGPQFDASGLLEARAQLVRLGEIEPLTAQQIGAESLILRIDESAAAQLLEQARWYLRTRDPISAELTLRRLLRRYPASVAALRAVDLGCELVAKLPPSIRETAPDYCGIRDGTVPMPRRGSAAAAAIEQEERDAAASAPGMPPVPVERLDEAIEAAEAESAAQREREAGAAGRSPGSQGGGP
ncbi:MAG TPA: outer membrane protein assembly factor BamD [Phycisphaerales bacterium]|mgnify:CR=1 FL=1|nr:outer membrane protein assembly factor BamD [Phycisphaerales bacterium]HMP36943.1 outer membrane protein assembly factor BamD [Phycisphaerales bacterium]